MPEPLRVSLVQTDLVWHQPEQNRAALAAKMAELAGTTDLVVLPEMFTSGFTTEPDATIEEGALSSAGTPTLNWMQQQAEQLGAAVTGSTVFKTPAGNTNRLWFVTPDGQVAYYDKVHLFRMAGEHERYRPGQHRVCVEYQGWKLLLTVCYDLRFPVFCRSRNDYDLLLCVASWPSSRRHPWRSLLVARAIENLSYVVGVNRVGTDGKGWHYSGDSLLVDYQGQILVDEPEEQEFIQTYTLDYQSLAAFRESFPAWMDADEFDIRLKQ
ncbi:amidohydrolase [Halioxenophilus sp. WMMB6]|uniref:amidohydrolase n=1 Tax=Halioxenophilus sp. WMMB6 TaxID=3073815 RepID=UPI00295F08F3|nr:amidohydrolase [Halioxenophilus sp. WMMB6]